MLLAHICIALLSIILSTYLYCVPSRAGLRLSYAFVALTVASGAYLVVVSHAAILRTCLAGLLYAGVVVVMITVAHHKLATQEIKNKS